MTVTAGRQRRTVGAGAALGLSRGGGVAVAVGGRAWQRTSDTVRCRSDADAVFPVGNRRYRGSILAFVNPDNELVVVNELGLDSYLQGVVPAEIGPIRRETFAAVKAQAVAARSFTLTRLARRKGLGFQLYDTYKRDQEYKGLGAEVELANEAVRQTRGEVLTWRGETVEALYHANCGGHTGTASKPYLAGVRDTPGHRSGRPFCAGGKHYSWTVTMSRAEFERKLGALLGAGGSVRLQGVKLDKERGSGRVLHLRLSTSKGGRRVAGSDFRFGIGLKSTLFDLKTSRSKVTITGRGWGHGKGMCQEGAIEMARRGNDYRRILTHYYSSVRISRLY
jgi:stage II sporulation protein D